MTALHTFEILIGTYLSLCTLLLFVLSIAGVRSMRPARVKTRKKRKLLVLIPAYKEDSVIVETAKKSLNQHYPEALYEVIVIADGLKNQTLEYLRYLPIHVFPVRFEKSTKVKALNMALDYFLDASFEGVVIIDADNIMHPNFLHYVNNALDNGMMAIQGQRMAKNKDSQFSFLDAVSEDVNNHIFCKGANNLGLSSRLAGSGMAFLPELLKSLLGKSKAIGGFDKELELEIVSKNIKINYVEDAIVFDEKVSGSKAFYTQRTRWIHAQYKYLYQQFVSGAIWKAMGKLNLDYLYKILVLVQPPRLLMPVSLMTLSMIYFMIQGMAGSTLLFIALTIINAITFLLAIPTSYFTKDSWSQWLALGNAFIQTIRALINLPSAGKSFLHTPHGSTLNDKNLNS